MKRIFNIISVAMILSLSSSCSFLEVEKIGKSDIQTYFSEVTALEPAMNGIYNLMYSFYDRYFIPYAEVCGDAMILSASAGGTWVDYQNFVTTSDYEVSAVGYLWKGGYEIINNANQVIHWAPLLKDSYPFDVELIDNVTAAALFVRALLHFDLCRIYGQNYTYTEDASHLGVAIRDKIPSLSETIARSTIKECYDQIEKDLHQALATFSNCTYNSFKPTPVACKALLSRLYLYKGDLENAVKYASEVIEQMSLTDNADYVDMFCDPQEIGTEAIFRLNGYEQTTSLNTMFHYQSPVGRPADGLRSSYASDDVRLQLFDYSYAGMDYRNVMLKYTCTKDVDSDNDRYANVFIFRLSEMYLIRAEALNGMNRSSDAETDLKTLIARAVGKNLSEITLEWSSAEDLDALISLERKKELCFEGHRFFDISRRHENLVRDASTTSIVKTLEYPDNRFVLQIPYVEIDANHEMQQNPL